MLDAIFNIITHMKFIKNKIIGLGPNSNLVKAYKESLKNLYQIQFESINVRRC